MNRSLITFIVVAIFSLGVSVSIFTVSEGQKAMIQIFGSLQKDPNTDKIKVYEPGLHFKIPFIASVLRFDVRQNLLDVDKSRITTSEKKDVIVDFYVLWQIDDIPLFYTRTYRNDFGFYKINNAPELLEQRVIAAIKAEFGRRTIKEVVSGERLQLMERLKTATDNSSEEMGLSVIDVRIKRIDLPSEVSESVYNRMRAERERAASETRSEGRADAIIISSKAENKQRVIIAEATYESKAIRGEADAIAAKIYADAYKRDADFYKFHRSMKAYQNTFRDHNDVLILSPDSDYFKYFLKYQDKLQRN